MEKCLIVAVSENWAIGRDNDMPWHISEDLKYFKRTTLGHPVIMGSRTYASIGRPLPKRLNIVITRRPWPEAPEGVAVVPSLEEAYAAAEASGAERCFVMGGGYTYREAMSSVDTLYVTHIRTVVPDADTFFPEIDPAVWRLDSTSGLLSEGAWTFEFTVYRRC